ncbi:hypothetical protein BRD13_05785 [Halobacteriales archaeon SW_5_70_135]|nr:MAG: hypothetical protein BRD13_05785 [Halobacteriales archaeon SW_5_70_135]
MDRRRCLRSVAAAAGVATAGCSGLDAGSQFPDLSVAAVDPVPLAEASADVAVERGFTGDRPATLRVALTNDADRERTVRSLMGLPFPPYDGHQYDGDGVVELVPRIEDYPDVVPAEPTRSCWAATRSAGGEDVDVGRTLAPGETFERRYVLLSAPRADGCVPAGRYRFEKERYADTGERWGFTVEATGDG